MDSAEIWEIFDSLNDQKDTINITSMNNKCSECIDGGLIIEDYANGCSVANDTNNKYHCEYNRYNNGLYAI